MRANLIHLFFDARKKVLTSVQHFQTLYDFVNSFQVLRWGHPTVPIMLSVFTNLTSKKKKEKMKLKSKKNILQEFLKFAPIPKSKKDNLFELPAEIKINVKYDLVLPFEFSIFSNMIERLTRFNATSVRPISLSTSKRYLVPIIPVER
jgi:hypothetical protein